MGAGKAWEAMPIGDTSDKPPLSGGKGILPHVIAISSGKGGVGKSSLTVNLGISLAKAGAKVCVFDADTGLANINILLGLAPHARLEHVLSGDMPIEDIMLDGPFGLKVIPGANGISSCVDLHPRQRLRLTRELARIENQFDYLLLDTAAGIADTTLDFVCAATHALIVITPEPTSLTDAFSLIKLLKRRKSGNDFHVAVNMCANAAQAREVYHRFSGAVKKYINVNLNYLGFIPRDESIRSAVTLQRPVSLFADTDPSCRNFVRLSDSLVSAIEKSSVVTTSFSAYWHRLSREAQEPVNAEKAVRALTGPKADKSQLKHLRNQWLDLVSIIQLQGQLRESLADICSAYISQYQELPLDVLSLLDMALADETSAADIAQAVFERIKPYLPVTPEPGAVKPAKRKAAKKATVEEPLPEETPALELAEAARQLYEAPVVAEPTLMPEVLSAWPNNAGMQFQVTEDRYNVGKYGSQDSLLAILRSENNKDKPLLDVICALSSG